MIYMAEKLTDFMLAPWPPNDLDEYAHIKEAMQKALRYRLISHFDLWAALRYSCGYREQTYHVEIERSFTVLATLTGYTDTAFVNRYFSHLTPQQKAVKLEMLQHASLWNN